MRTLIVLCAGNRMIYNLPLFLQRHPEGKLLAEKAIEGIFSENYNRIVFSILAEVNHKYDAKNKIINELGKRYSVDVVILPKSTTGPAETVYKTLEYGNITGEIVVRDSHDFIRIKKDVYGNFIAGLDLTRYEKSIEELRTKSFIVLNEQNQVLDVIEKHFRSDVISVGLYGFKSSDEFKLAFEHLSDKNYPIKKLYVSHIIAYLIGYRQKVFNCVEVKEFEDWGTLNSWSKVQKRYVTCFLNMDTICGHTIPFGKEIIETLKKASLEGCRFIFFSALNDVCVSEFEIYLRHNNVNVLAVISGCTNSKIRIIAEDIETLNNIILEGK